MSNSEELFLFGKVWDIVQYKSYIIRFNIIRLFKGTMSINHIILLYFKLLLNPENPDSSIICDRNERSTVIF